ncbi:histone-lysine N-methyltransferase SETD1B-like isoform X1 [Mytilus trossulus]|uniref:histone-lysine N-methyltransferase SETD1B-like isoform X1 n=1 Tax=Mytilus trossulus TaxID=6551 RepID=UPI00300553E5
MTIKRKDFQKAAAFLHEFLLKLNEESECAELRDVLNLALLQLQKYYRQLQNRSQDKNVTTLSLTARGLSPMTPFVDAPDKFQWKWLNLDSIKNITGVRTDESMNITVLPPLIDATKQGDYHTVKELIADDPSHVEERDGTGRTPLYYAIHFKHMEILHHLLENSCEVNTSAHDGSTALHQACHDSNHVGLSLLLQCGGDFTIQDTQGRAPIHWAVTTKTTECLKYLIANQADVNVRDKDGLTPCMWACRLDHIKHFELLTSSRSFRPEEHDGIERDNGGRTWMHWSIRRTEPLECLQTLLTAETATIQDEDGKTVLLLAAEMGSLLACKIIVEIGGYNRVHDRDNQDRTVLHLAAIGGHGDVVNYLLDKGAELEARDKFNISPWDYAKNKQLHYCQLIIMSHQRQRLKSNPTSPLPNGLGLSLGSLNGYMNGDDYDHMINTQDSFDNMPITPPHPPKRPRTGRHPIRRSHSLTSPDRGRSYIPADQERLIISAGGDLQQGRSSLTSDRPNSYSNREQYTRREPGRETGRTNERIEVSLNPRQTSADGRIPSEHRRRDDNRFDHPNGHRRSDDNRFDHPNDHRRTEDNRFDHSNDHRRQEDNRFAHPNDHRQTEDNRFEHPNDHRRTEDNRFDNPNDHRRTEDNRVDPRSDDRLHHSNNRFESSRDNRFNSEEGLDSADGRFNSTVDSGFHSNVNRRLNSTGDGHDDRRFNSEYEVLDRPNDVDMEDDNRSNPDDDIDNVSVGGMDVSDIEDDERGPPMTSRRSDTRSDTSGSVHHPRPPPRKNQQKSYAQPLEPPYRQQSSSQDYNEYPDDRRDNFRQNDVLSRSDGFPNSRQDNFPKNRSMEFPGNKSMQPMPPSKFNQRVISPNFNPPSNSNTDNFPPGKPRPAPRQPSMPKPRPPPRRTPSPTQPGSRDQIYSPPLSSQSNDLPIQKPSPPPPIDSNRPDSGSKPPGVVEGRRIPPPMLMPLENAPKPPMLSILDRKTEKRKKRRKKKERDQERERERDLDLKSPPMDIEPPRGYAAPLHPPPSATSRPPRAQSGVPAPKFSKQPPQRHEQRLVYESMDEEIKDDFEPPKINGHAVPIKEGPPKSGKPVHRTQSLESEDLEMELIGQSYDTINEEDDQAGPLIPPPKGFGTPSKSPSGRPLSHSIPQDNRTARMTPTSAKPPLPQSGRSSGQSGRTSASYRRKSPSPHRRSRPPTGGRSSSTSS